MSNLMSRMSSWSFSNSLGSITNTYFVYFILWFLKSEQRKVRKEQTIWFTFLLGAHPTRRCPRRHTASRPGPRRPDNVVGSSSAQEQSTSRSPGRTPPTSSDTSSALEGRRPSLLLESSPALGHPAWSLAPHPKARTIAPHLATS